MTESTITPREAKLSAELHDALQANANLGIELGALKQEYDGFMASARVTQENRDLARGRVAELEALLSGLRKDIAEAIHWEDMQSVMKRIDAALAAHKLVAQQPAAVDALPEMGAYGVELPSTVWDGIHQHASELGGTEGGEYLLSPEDLTDLVSVAIAHARAALAGGAQ